MVQRERKIFPTSGNFNRRHRLRHDTCAVARVCRLASRRAGSHRVRRQARHCTAPAAVAAILPAWSRQEPPKRHPMLDSGFHPILGDRPNLRGKVDFRPHGADDFAAAHRRRARLGAKDLRERLGRAPARKRAPRSIPGALSSRRLCFSLSRLRGIASGLGHARPRRCENATGPARRMRQVRRDPRLQTSCFTRSVLALSPR